MSILDRIRVVLVNTSHPGNIGSTARAMKTMGLSQLVLVEPRLFPHQKATELASNADDVLQSARVVKTLDDAIGDCRFVLGTSARMRTLPWPMMTPREAAAEALTQANTGTDVAIIFGREDAGLTNEELQRCNAHICIPANPVYNVLNLAQAVQIVSYECHLASLTDDPLPPPLHREPLATAKEIQGFYQHLESVFKALEFHDPANSKQLLPRMKRMFARVQLEKREVSILRGVFAGILRLTRR